MFKKTLICLDGSKLAEEVLPYIVDSCSASGTEIVLLSVITSHITIPPPETIHAYTFGKDFKPALTHTSDMGEDPTLEPQFELQFKEIEKEQDGMKRYLEGLARPLRANGLKIRTVILEGTVPDTILDYANNNHVSLIAITTHGAGGLKKKGMFGRVAQSILKESVIPVLLIKPRGDSA
jgi:nucleotide-binding universal stress UspA family protein